MATVLSLVLLACSAKAVVATAACSEGDATCSVAASDGDATNLMQSKDKSILRSPRRHQSKGNNYLVVPSFVPYFNYEGPIDVSGTITVTTDGTTQGLIWDLRNADGNCGYTAFPNGESSNDCGIHIHVGTSCTEDAGGHYFATTEDPWKAVHYEVKDCLTQNPNEEKVSTGLTQDDILGHAMIVHDISGGRIACGIIQAPLPTALVVSSFVKYFNYEGPLTVSGTIEVNTLDNQQYLAWSLTGQDANCGCQVFPNGQVSNDCGIHIHVGTDCTSDAGGHYFATTSDPWKAVHYATASGTAVSSGVNVTTDLSEDDIKGHAMIVHDITGARIACGIIEEGAVGGCYLAQCGCPPYSSGASWCSSKTDWRLPSNWCNENQDQCEGPCNGKWCLSR